MSETDFNPEDYNWEAAFSEAGLQNANVVEGSFCSDEPFKIEDIDYTIASNEGERDGLEWLWLGKLKDSRFGFLSAGCDYTGWD